MTHSQANGVGSCENGPLNGPPPSPVKLECLIIGAGFTGCYLLHKLRLAGFDTKVVEMGSDLGGVWYWNRYPGARVDSPYPVYSLSPSEVWKDWNWSEFYPSGGELRQYFDHVDKQLHLRKDMIFNTKVVAATFQEDTDHWLVTCDNGREFLSKTLVSGTGFSAKRYTPNWKGMDIFKGQLIHSSFWTKDIDVKGKHLAVVGAGASGVQIAQECAEDVEHLTAFIRTPNLCLPMRQRNMSLEEQQQDKLQYPEVFKQRLTTYGGLTYGPLAIPHMAHSKEQREALFEKLWAQGGFAFMSGSYCDFLTDPACNKYAYDFWLRKTRARIPDPEKAEILAPTEGPHPIGAKRPSLEQDYYEKMSRSNVSVVSVVRNPIVEFVEDGIITSDGQLHQADIVALATGFDAVTGGLKSITITGVGGQKLADKWEFGTATNLGIATHGFPNFFFSYGPQSPTAFANGPSCVEAQSDWITQILIKMRDQGLKRIDANEDAEVAWKHLVNSMSEHTLLHGVDSWYNGANIPGKPKEALNFCGGLPMYVKQLQDSLDNNFQGFTVSPTSETTNGEKMAKASNGEVLAKTTYGEPPV